MRKIAFALFFLCLVLCASHTSAQTSNMVLAREYVGYAKEDLQSAMDALPLEGVGPRFSPEPYAIGFRFEGNRLLVWVPRTIKNCEVILFCVIDGTDPQIPGQQSIQEHLGVVRKTSKHSTLEFDKIYLRKGVYWLFMRNTHSGMISFLPISIRV